ncbi:MAG: HdeD family acid-resistance protein [Acidimicrobiales bacterium]
MLKSLSTSLVLRGLLALGIGVVALAWPGVTVLALVVLFAVYAFIAAGLQALRAFSSRTAGPVFGHLLLGLVDIAAGLVALAWPGPTALVLVLLVASWAIVTGALELFAAFAKGEEAGSRAMFVLGGLVSMAFGTVLFARPDMGAITLALLFGLFNLISGSWMLVRGIELRRTNATLHSLVAPRKRKAAA